MKQRSENVEMAVRSVPRRSGLPEAYDQYVEDVQIEKCTPGGHIRVRSSCFMNIPGSHSAARKDGVPLERSLSGHLLTSIRREDLVVMDELLHR